MKTYILYRLSAWSLFKIGFLVGWIASFLPIASGAYILMRIVTGVANWLGNMVYQFTVPLLGNIDINVVEMLGLQQFYANLANWATIGTITLCFIILLLTSLAALFWGVIAALAGLVFNLLSHAIGGVRLTMAEESVQVGSAAALPAQEIQE
jgi:hypothetical protein